MTWNQFKARVDELLDEQGVSHDTQIWYVEAPFPSKDMLAVTMEIDIGIAIHD